MFACLIIVLAVAPKGLASTLPPPPGLSSQNDKLKQSSGRRVPSDERCSYADSYPRQYISYFASEPPVLDGIVTESFWEDVPWTDDFVDIATNGEHK